MPGGWFGKHEFGEQQVQPGADDSQQARGQERREERAPKDLGKTRMREMMIAAEGGSGG